MSSQPDYSFNQPASSASESNSILLPFALLSTAIAIMMIAQTWGVFKQRSALHEGEAQLVDYARNREGAKKESDDLQLKLQNLAMDLLLLSKTDPDAQAIIQKYNIQQAGNSGAAPAPAAAPAK